jgi:hypothetical protein
MVVWNSQRPLQRHGESISEMDAIVFEMYFQHDETACANIVLAEGWRAVRSEPQAFESFIRRRQIGS